MLSLRLVSLLPSATEILHALGLGSYQVGRSHECDFPSSVTELPVCSRPNIAVGGSSLEIDRLVRDRVANALSIYDVYSERLAQLQPTHILTQTQCKVCAVSLDDVESALPQTTGTTTRVLSLEPHVLADLWTDIRMVARSCNVEAPGETVIGELQHRIDAIERRTAKATTRPTVAAIEWLEPVMTAGNWMPELIEKAGGRPLFGETVQHSPYLDWDQIAAADSEILILLPCGFDLERTCAESHWLAQRPGWGDLKAVRSNRVYICDGHQFFNRPGPRLVESLQALAEMIHPELFKPELEGCAWRTLEPRFSLDK